MFYPSYDDYMRDVFYFNGLSNPNNMCYMNGINNNPTNLNNLYPSIYKIINPVVQKVVSGNNYQFVNEETVNNIVDVVLGITAGDINGMEKEANQEIRKQNNSNMNSNSQTSSNNISNNTSYNDSLLRDLIKILVIKELISKSNVTRFPFTYGTMPYYMNGQMPPYMVN